MSLEFGPCMEEGDFDEVQILPSLVQSYRCPQGHLSNIVWTAGEMMIACEAGDVRFFCRRCKTGRYASEPETSSLLAAFGLLPALRIYAS